MRKYWYLFACLLLTACIPQEKAVLPQETAENIPATLAPSTSPTQLVELDDYGPAPELTNDIWLNVDFPLRLKDLRGKVILLDMWTFG